eukprot:4789405-Prymnesium_polylepis.1
MRCSLCGVCGSAHLGQHDVVRGGGGLGKDLGLGHQRHVRHQVKKLARVLSRHLLEALRRHERRRVAGVRAYR